ncbi:MAG: class I SAM-dependent RNA methyltransferase, partial [Leptolyngbya sp. SIO3F4]|nr:class I SAM-dependent RNA methyltransferase [Leptolyngbya sp. SIO3F4]
LQFEISMESFFQPNPRTAALLYTRAAEYVFEGQENESGVVMDLFCGTGTIGQVLTKQGQGKRPIIGVDIIDRAIEDARENAQRNGLEGLEFFAADVGKFLLQYPEYKGNIHTVVLDPPRGGIAPKTLKRILELEAQRIVYVSCNPATQARDTVELTQAGYVLRKLTMVDQFPHTAHIETVALFDKQA